MFIKEEIRREIGKRLKELRRQRGFTQRQIAKYLGINQKQLAWYEKGRGTISTYILERLARLYGCNYKYLLGNDESSKRQITANFSTHKISDEDLEVIAFANQFVMNLDTMYSMDEKLKNRPEFNKITERRS